MKTFNQGSRVLLIAILASFVVFLDGSVVNVALPAISRDLGGGLSTQQWVVDAYLITLGALILTAGSLTDLFGRKRMLLYGLVGFGIASVFCAIAPNATLLIVARALQGMAGALLVPSSLALIISSFEGKEQGRAIGRWTAWTGIAFLVGPLLGGFMVDALSWRLMFAINVIPIAGTLLLLNSLTADKTHQAAAHVDILGTVLCAAGLGGPVFALIEQSHFGWSHPVIYLPLLLGITAFTAFLLHERRTAHPMLPLSIFKARNFWAGNLATFAIYAGLSVSSFLIAVFVQQVGHYSALMAGMAMLPVTIMMFLLSSRFGTLSGRYGPRLFTTAGPLVGALGFLYMLRVSDPIEYWTELLPGILLFGLGLSMTVSPLTSAVLGAVKQEFAGTGSAVNNAVSRIAGLIAIAVLGAVIGTTIDLDGFLKGLLMTAGLLIIGAAISALGITNTASDDT